MANPKILFYAKDIVEYEKLRLPSYVQGSF